MAILKHIASKNADYGEAQRYLMFQYDEDTNKPPLDENGELIPRKEYIMDGINCDPFTFDMECRELNALYYKNESYQQFCKAKNKGQFRKEHTTEIALYEAARKFLKGQSTDGRLPSMKLLKAEKGNTENIPLLPGLPERIDYGMLQCRYDFRQAANNKQTEKEKNADIS